MNNAKALDRYFQLMNERPEEFSDSDYLFIEKDRSVIEKYIEDTGKSLGVVYESPYNMMVVDLIRNNDGSFFTYERILHTSCGNCVVCLTVYGDRFVLLKQYRHAMRDYQLSFPRGYGEDGLNAQQNAEKELYEEINAQIHSIQHIGKVIADSGLVGEAVDVMLCRINSLDLKKGTEGIDNIILVTRTEFDLLIKKGVINDGYTLSAYAFYLSSFND